MEVQDLKVVQAGTMRKHRADVSVSNMGMHGFSSETCSEAMTAQEVVMMAQKAVQGERKGVVEYSIPFLDTQ